jgi:hypothetical protein
MMAAMVYEVYDAFRSVGIDEEKARRAAEAMNNETTATKADIFALKSEVAVLKWMAGATLALVITIFWKLFS